MDMMKTGKGGGKQKKITVRVDFTPMVDMLMLLITFFMLCTSLSKPSTMELTMPSNDKNTDQVKKNEAKDLTLSRFSLVKMIRCSTEKVNQSLAILLG